MANLRTSSRVSEQNSMKGRIPESHQLDEDDNDSSLSSQAATSSPSPFLAFLKSNPLIIMVAALAIGVYLGMKHQSQGVDLADSISTFIYEGRSDSMTAPAPTLATPSLASSSQQEHLAGTPIKARKKQRQSKQQGQERATTSRLVLSLSQNVTVHICRNGQSTPIGTLHLTPNSTRCLEDLRDAVGDLLPACHHGVCRLFDRYGYEIKALGALQDEQLLFAVLPKRHFIWPAFEVGHKVAVPGVTSSIPGQPITLETLSESPRVFLVENFLSPQDAEDLIENALGRSVDNLAHLRIIKGKDESVSASFFPLLGSVFDAQQTLPFFPSFPPSLPPFFQALLPKALPSSDPPQAQRGPRSHRGGRVRMLLTLPRPLR